MLIAYVDLYHKIQLAVNRGRNSKSASLDHQLPFPAFFYRSFRHFYQGVPAIFLNYTPLYFGGTSLRVG